MNSIKFYQKKRLIKHKHKMKPIYKYFNDNGKLHRENGPAVEYKNGYKAWYINGTNYNEKKYELEIERIRKIRFKYFKLWELNCDQPGKNLFSIRINKAMDNIEELEKKY